MTTDDAPTRAVGHAVADPSAAPPPAGTQIADRYVVIDPLGSGGMGTVVRAYDAKLRREVALKQVRADTLGPEGEARLLREARAMAQLSHPNVVAVYDVDVDGQSVTIAMELVVGKTLRQWLRDAPRSSSEILDVFIMAGRGLVAAHHASIVHRDFKPANVLIGAAGEVKVTDFGLAKPVSEDSSGSSVSSLGEQHSRCVEVAAVTEAGSVMGTPRYMAPEQHRGTPTGPSTDQYAFGVALWEALAADPPFSGGEMFHAKLRGAPAWPVTKARVPAPIVAAIKRSLAPTPADRWPSMEALLQALAHDPTARRRGWSTAIVAVGLLGGGGLMLRAWHIAESQRCSGAAEQLAGVWDATQRDRVRRSMLAGGMTFSSETWKRVETGLRDYSQVWVERHAEACEATRRGEQSAEAMDLRIGCLQRAKIAVAEAVDVLATDDPKVVEKAVEIVTGLPSLARCRDIEALRAEVPPPEDPAVAAAVDEHRQVLARIRSLDHAGRYAAAYEAARELQPLAEATQYVPLEAEVSVARGRALIELGRYEEAEPDLRRGMRLALGAGATRIAASAATTLTSLVGHRRARPEEGRWLGQMAVSFGRRLEDRGLEANAHNALGLVLLREGLHTDAEARHRQALGLWEEVAGSEHLNVAVSRSQLAFALFEQARYEEALTEQRAVIRLRASLLGAQHPDTARAHSAVATTLFAQGRYKDGEKEHRAALSILEPALGEAHPDTIMSRSNLANTVHAQGRYAEAEAEYRKLLGLRRKVLGPEHPEVGVAQSNLGLALHWQGKFTEAESEFRQAVALLLSALGPAHPQVAMARDNLGLTLHALHRDAEAAIEHRRALELREAQLGPDHPAVGASRGNLAYALQGQGKLQEAEREARQSLRIFEHALGPAHSEVGICLQALASILIEQQRMQEAQPLLERALEVWSSGEAGAEPQAQTEFLLAKVSWALGERERASSLAESARVGFAEHPAERSAVERWLAERRHSD